MHVAVKEPREPGPKGKCLTSREPPTFLEGNKDFLSSQSISPLLTKTIWRKTYYSNKNPGKRKNAGTLIGTQDNPGKCFWMVSSSDFSGNDFTRVTAP
jgi:hypothetical protein